MHCSSVVRLSLGVAAAALVAAAPLLAIPPQHPPKGARVAVVAIHDTDLLTLCPNALDPHVRVAGPGGSVVTTLPRATAAKDRIVLVTYPRAGFQNVGVAGDPERFVDSALLPVSELHPPSVSVARPDVAVTALDRLAPDPGVRARLEQQFRKLNTYVVVDSPDQADFVFLVESRYAPWAFEVSPVAVKPAAETARGDVSRKQGAQAIFNDAANDWARRQFRYGDNGEEYQRMVDASRPLSQTPSTVTYGARGGDRFRNWRESLIAMAIPAGRYRGHEGDGEALVTAAVWSNWQTAGRTRSNPTLVASSPELAVHAFHGKGLNLPSYLPVCAVAGAPIATIDQPAARTASPATTTETPSDAPGASLSGSRSALFRSAATLVTVPTSLTPGTRDLDKTAFHVFEDDVEQTVDRVDAGGVPTDVALLIDTSSGMRRAIEGLRGSAQTLAASLPAGTRVMVAAFDSRVRVLSDWTSDRADTQQAIARITSTGVTRLYDAIVLTTIDRMRASDRRKVIVLFTDGVDTGSQLTGIPGALAAIDSENVSVYVVRYDTSDAPSPYEGLGKRGFAVPGDTQRSKTAVLEADEFLQRIADDSGGRYYLAATDSNPSELFATIAQDLSSQYLLRYYPKNGALDGSYRTIRVTVDRPDVTVRARAGYRAGVLLVGK